MKKIFIILAILVFCVSNVRAKEIKDYSIKFNNEKYNLLYSVKSQDFGGYLNEYFRQGETYNLWTDMVAVHHFPNAYSPIDRIREFKEYLSSIHCPSSLTFDDRKNTAMIDFILISGDKLPIILEFNVFKYEKSKKCGSIAIQYAKRYKATTTLEIEEIKKDFEKNRKRYIKEIKKFEIPQVVTENIDKCISLDEIKKDAEAEVLANDELKQSSDNITENVQKNSTSESENIQNEEENEVAIDKNDDIVESSIESEKENEITEKINNEIQKSNYEQKNETNIHEAIKQVNSTYENDQTTEELILKEGTKSQEVVEKEQEKEEETLTKENNTEDNTKETAVDEEDEVIYDETPVKISVDKIKCKKQTKKKIKTKEYKVVNDKSSYYATPRSVKELKQQTKSKKKTRRGMKKRAKMAEKKLME